MRQEANWLLLSPPSSICRWPVPYMRPSMDAIAHDKSIFVGFSGLFARRSARSAPQASQQASYLNMVSERAAQSTIQNWLGGGDKRISIERNPRPNSECLGGCGLEPSPYPYQLSVFILPILLTRIRARRVRLGKLGGSANGSIQHRSSCG